MVSDFAARLSKNRLLWLLLLLGTGCGLLAWAQRSGSSIDREARDSVAPAFVATQSIAPPAFTASRFRNTQPEAQYIGTDQCRACHASEHASYLETAQSQSLTEVNPLDEPPDATFDHQASSRRFSVYRRDGQLRHRETLLPPDGPMDVLQDHPVRYVVGSGRFTRTYLVQQNDFLVESPVTWYASLQRWAMSPGFDRSDHPSFHRVVKYDCVFCHAGRLESPATSAERMHVLETSIGCERCHGPGSLHAERWKDATVDGRHQLDDTIVNPRHLSRELAEAICHQCHLASDVLVSVRGRGRGDFRPGLLWQDFYVNYSVRAKRDEMTVTGHVEQMQQSRCYQESTALTCLTCHDPHGRLSPVAASSHYRRVCLSCHDNNACGLSQRERKLRDDDHCVACHMPNSKTDIPHIAFTHHRIAIHKADAATRAQFVLGEPRPILNIDHHGEADRQRALGLAYREVASDPRYAQYQRANIELSEKLLSEAAGKGVADGTVLAALAEAASFHGRIEEAEAWATRALGLPRTLAEDHLVATDILARLNIARGEWKSAAQRLRQLVTERRNPGDWFLLGLCEQQQGQTDEAIACWEHVLSLDPAQPETYDVLAPAYLTRGESARAAWCRERAATLRRISQHQIGLNLPSATK